MRRALLALCLPVVVAACGTIFPRYTTAMRAPPAGMLETAALRPPPEGMRTVSFLSAELPPSRPDGRTWDDDGPPDLYAVLFRNDEEVYRTPVVRDSLRPSWEGATVTLRFGTHERYRIELRDDDGALDSLDQLVAQTQFMGAPTGAIEGSNTVLRLENGVVVTLRSDAPTPMLGMGVTYEVHEEYLQVLAVEPSSSGAAAGLQVGDRIVSVDGRTVESLGEVGARQSMDRAALRDVSLTVQRAGRPMFVVDVRLDAVYPAR